MTEIDIQYDKTIEWLLSRRKLTDTWTSTLKGLQAKIKECQEVRFDDPAVDEFMAKHTEAMTFLQVEELWGLILKTKDGQKKNLIGRYTDPKVKDWKVILDNYKKNGVYLSDLAKEMTQSARYDIPAVKKQADACQKQMQDASRRQQELQKAELEAKKKFRLACEEQGIPGVMFRQELQERVRTELPRVLDEATSLLAAKGPSALQYYFAFINYIDGAKVNEANVLPLLQFMIKKGNVTLKDAASLNDDLKAEWKRIEKEYKGGKKKSAEPEASSGIDWGITDDTGAGDGSIDWGGGGDDNADAGGISWDFTVEDTGGGDTAGAGGDDGGIDWGAISLDACEGGVSGAALGVSEADVLEEKAEDVLLLQNSKARNLLVDEVLELEAFLSQRVWELQNKRDAASQLAQSGNLDVQISLDEVKSHLEGVKKITEALSGKKTQSLVMMANSESSLSHAVAQLNTQKALCEKPSKQHAALEKRKAELQEEVKNNTDEAGRLRAEAKKIQKRLEEEIGTLIKSKIRIVGDINRV